jgi:ubiquinone/menaquinone biosynthesis C-methylase UbiE
MSRFESAFCRGACWRTFARRIVLPWALQDQQLAGEVLEIGGGSGAMAEQLLATHPRVRMTVTDYDEVMVSAARARLARFADRLRVQQADATRLPFPDGSFGTVLSFIMFHHVVDWEAAVDEAVRVLRPGGRLIGYDLLSSRPARWLHQAEGAGHRLATLAELRERLARLPVSESAVRPGLAGIVMRFSARKAG